MRLDKEEIADVRAIVREVLREHGLETRPTFEDAAGSLERTARAMHEALRQVAADRRDERLWDMVRIAEGYLARLLQDLVAMREAHGRRK